MTKEKSYIVALDISFTTPVDAMATSEKEAEIKAKAEFMKIFSEFKKKLNDITNEEINIDYIELDGVYDDEE